MSRQKPELTVGTVCLPEFTMDYFSFGQGDKPLVIIPGMSVKSILLSAEAVANAYAPFGERFRVYVPDYRRELPLGFPVREMARDTAAVMRHWGVDHATILGTSLGGMIAQYLAIDAPELVDRLVLGSTLPRHTKKSRAVFEKWVRLARAKDHHALQTDIVRRVYSPAYARIFGQLFSDHEKTFTDAETERYARLCEACMGFCAYDELQKIKCRTLVIGCWQDRTLYPEGSLLLAKKLRCDLFMYAGYSHAVYDEAPDFRERLKAFLIAS